jgi:hypothetical protein
MEISLEEGLIWVRIGTQRYKIEEEDIKEFLQNIKGDNSIVKLFTEKEYVQIEIVAEEFYLQGYVSEEVKKLIQEKYSQKIVK